jgi:hypothetical protein
MAGMAVMGLGENCVAANDGDSDSLGQNDAQNGFWGGREWRCGGIRGFFASLRMTAVRRVTEVRRMAAVRRKTAMRRLTGKEAEGRGYWVDWMAATILSMVCMSALVPGRWFPTMMEKMTVRPLAASR